MANQVVAPGPPALLHTLAQMIIDAGLGVTWTAPVDWQRTATVRLRLSGDETRLRAVLSQMEAHFTNRTVEIRGG